jgi:hypothetical protein
MKKETKIIVTTFWVIINAWFWFWIGSLILNNFSWYGIPFIYTAFAVVSGGAWFILSRETKE